MSHWLERLADLGIRRPWPLLSAALVLLVVCGIYGGTTPVDSSRNTMVSADNPHQALQLSFFERFGLPRTQVLILEGGDTADRQAAVDSLLAVFAADDMLRDRILGRLTIESMAELTLLHAAPALAVAQLAMGTTLDSLIAGGPERWLETVRGLERPALTEAVITWLETVAAGQDALALPAGLGAERPGVDARGYLVNAAGSLHFVALFPVLPSDQGRDMRRSVDHIRALRDQALVAHPRVQASLTGAPALTVDEEDQIAAGIARSAVFTGLGIVLLLLLAFRSLRYAILALIPVAVGVNITMAVARLIYGELNMVTSSASSVLLALGIDFGVYLLSRYGELVRGGAGAEEAIRQSIRRAGGALFVGAVTTSLAFLTTATTEFTAYARLGIVITVGLMLTMAATLIVMPALIWVAGRGRELSAPELPGIAALTPFIRRFGRPLVAGGLVLVTLGLIQARGLDFNTRFYDFLPSRGESAAALLAIEHDPVATPLIATVAADDFAAARSTAALLRARPEVANVWTPSDAVPPLTPALLNALSAVATPAAVRATESIQVATPEQLARSMRGLADPRLDALADRLGSASESGDDPEVRQRFAIMQTRLSGVLQRAFVAGARVATQGRVRGADLPPALVARHASLDGEAIALEVVPAGNIWDPATAAAFASAVSEVAPAATGMAMHIDAHLNMILDGFTRAAWLSAGLVLLVLLGTFRRLDDALLAMVPPLAGFAWMLGTMHVIGFPLDAANIITLPLIMGVGVDSGVHLVHRMRQSAAAHGGVADLGEVVGGTGAAVALAACTTALGFGALTLAEYGAMTSLGAAMALGVLTSLLASLLLVPALMVTLRRAA
ncbi:MAG: hypothetical protein ACI9WU_002708 [Myxococcota bacterium]|jgi:hypothetical protein